MLQEPKISSGNSIPKDSIINNGFGEYNYFDCYEIILNGHYPVEQISKELFESPKWVMVLMYVRDLIVKPFGLKTNQDAAQIRKDTDEFFVKLIEKNDFEIVGGDNDIHLNFRASVFSKPIDEQSIIRVSTIVKFNNLFGRVYFLPVKPFHRLIVKSMLKRLYCKLNYDKTE